MPDKNRETSPAERQAPSTVRDPGAIATPSVRNEVGRPDAELLPYDPEEGSGQRLSELERAELGSDAELEDARRKADEDYRRAQAQLNERRRNAHAEQLDRERKDALSVIEEQEQALRQRQQASGAMFIDQGLIEAQGALARARAAALKQDETVPGGLYIVNGRRVDADGNWLD